MENPDPIKPVYVLYEGSDTKIVAVYYTMKGVNDERGHFRKNPLNSRKRLICSTHTVMKIFPIVLEYRNRAEVHVLFTGTDPNIIAVYTNEESARAHRDHGLKVGGYGSELQFEKHKVKDNFRGEGEESPKKRARPSPPSERERKLESLLRKFIPHLFQPGDIFCHRDNLDSDDSLPPRGEIKSVSRSEVYVCCGGGRSHNNVRVHRLRRLSDKDNEKYKEIKKMRKSKKKMAMIQLFNSSLKTTECEGDEERFEALISAEKIRKSDN